MKVLIASQPEYANAFDRTKHQFTSKREEISNCDLVLFTGGSDVDPSLYLAKQHPLTSSILSRDLDEQDLYREAKKHKIPCVGICRGSQFLCVMNGGTLIQHVTGHGLSGTHAIFNHTQDDYIMVTSTHHQMMAPQGAYQVVAWAYSLSDCYQDGDQREDHSFVDSSKEVADGTTSIREPEVVYWPHHRDLGVQYHPEYMAQDTDGWQYFNRLIDGMYGPIVQGEHV